MTNVGLLKKRAETLQHMLDALAPIEPEAAILLSQLSGLIAQAIKGEILVPMTTVRVPGARLFNEGSLSENTQLADAYFKFQIELTGGPPPGLQKLRAQSGCDPLTGDPIELGV